jgi:hypothetical protein
MNALAALDAAMIASAHIVVRRTPNRTISAAANGPTRPYNRMPTAAANEIEARSQPKAASIGNINTPGVARTPALTISAKNTTATTTNT